MKFTKQEWVSELVTERVNNDRTQGWETNNIYLLRGANIFQESHFRLGELTSSTWPPLGCYLISALGSTSSSAPLQVHLGRGDLPLTTVITLYCLSNLLFADIPYPPDYNVLISWMQKWSLFSLQTPRSNSADSSGEGLFQNHYNCSYVNSH